MLTLHQGVLVFISSTHLEQRGVKEAREHIFPLLFIQKKKPNLWVPGSNFQVPDPGFQIFGCSPYKEVKSNDSTKNQTPTILLFLAMYLDILLKEAKAMCFSRFPRLHVSKGMHLYKLLKKQFKGHVSSRTSEEDTTTRKEGANELTQEATHIKKSHQHAHGKGDSRRGDESLSDVQKTLRVAHQSGRREQPEEVIKRHLQKEQIQGVGAKQYVWKINSRNGLTTSQYVVEDSNPLLSKLNDEQVLLLTL